MDGNTSARLQLGSLEPYVREVWRNGLCLRERKLQHTPLSEGDFKDKLTAIRECWHSGCLSCWWQRRRWVFQSGTRVLFRICPPINNYGGWNHFLKDERCLPCQLCTVNVKENVIYINTCYSLLHFLAQIHSQCRHQVMLLERNNKGLVKCI